MKRIIPIILVGLVMILIAFVIKQSNMTPTPAPSSTPVSSREVRSVADEIVMALKSKDMEKIASMSASEVRFSPYIYVDIQNHRLLPTEVIKNLFLISAAYTWGTYDGSGEPIVLGPGPYFEKFIYDKDYANAPQVLVNDLKNRGNVINNLKTVYPNAQYVEYYIPPSEEGGLDWSSLILVLEEINGEWKIIGVVHDQWTI